MSDAWRIVADDLTHPDVLALLDLHLRAAHAKSLKSIFVLDLDGLRDARVDELNLEIGANAALAPARALYEAPDSSRHRRSVTTG